MVGGLVLSVLCDDGTAVARVASNSQLLHVLNAIIKFDSVYRQAVVRLVELKLAMLRRSCMLIRNNRELAHIN